RVIEGEDPLVVWGSGEQTRTFLYVEDFVEGILRIAEAHAAGEPVNLGSREETTIRALVERILALTGRSPPGVFDPAPPEGQPRRSWDTARMRQVLGWEPATPLAEGLARTIAWYREAAADPRRA